MFRLHKWGVLTYLCVKSLLNFWSELFEKVSTPWPIQTSAHLRETSGFDSSTACSPSSARVEAAAGPAWALPGGGGGGGGGGGEATLSNWGPVFSLIIDNVNTRIDDVEASNQSRKQDLEELQKETERLRLQTQEDQRQLAEMAQRLQKLVSLQSFARLMFR